MSGGGGVDIAWSDAGLLVLSLDNPDRANAMSYAMLSSLAQTIEEVPAGTRGVVITGRGGWFSGGIDLSQRGTTVGGATVQEQLERVTTAIRHAPAPVAALINGACVGASVELAVSCDLRVGVRPMRVKVPATRIGVVYRADGYRTLLRRLDTTTVRQLLLLGMEYGADQALARGVVEVLAEDGSQAMTRIGELLTGLEGPTFVAQKAALDAALESRGIDEEA